MHWTSLYRVPQPCPLYGTSRPHCTGTPPNMGTHWTGKPHTPPPPHTHTSWTWDLTVLGTPLLLLTSGRHHLRPVQTCSLQDRRADIWWVLKHSQLVRADGLHPTGMLSCCSMFSTRVNTADKKDRNEEGKDENGL